MKRNSILIFSLLLVFFGLTALAADKNICAHFAITEPAIDGVLDDVCWAKTEFTSDFTYRSTDVPLVNEERIDMGIVFTAKSFSIALRAKIKHPELATSYFAETARKIKEGGQNSFRPKYSVEIFYSPRGIASSKQTWQILADSFGRHNVRHSIYWNDFPGKIESAGNIRGDIWTFELKVEHGEIKAGDRWPFNIVVNEHDVPFSIWQNVGSVFYTPHNMAGRLLFGSADEWSRIAVERYEALFAEIEKAGAQIPSIVLYIEAVREAKSDFDVYRKTLGQVGNLAELSTFMDHFKPFQNLFERLVSVYEFETCRANLENKK